MLGYLFTDAWPSFITQAVPYQGWARLHYNDLAKKMICFSPAKFFSSI